MAGKESGDIPKRHVQFVNGSLVAGCIYSHTGLRVPLGRGGTIFPFNPFTANHGYLSFLIRFISCFIRNEMCVSTGTLAICWSQIKISNSQLLEVVSRHGDTQLQVEENRNSITVTYGVKVYYI